MKGSIATFSREAATAGSGSIFCLELDGRISGNAPETHWLGDEVATSGLVIRTILELVPTGDGIQGGCSVFWIE